ncbi:malonate decarboxylase holo-ACP synthase [Halobacillus massiliensis]|uniref:malonate decarboxylase holo-ACP synthase n=1 Tax=Halobacillus massiliensis TaxID=1926286 RepID=UPI0009E4F291|nr:malonate decarboxylase holo-ACP synthase [Halobacillus massiliensis]
MELTPHDLLRVNKTVDLEASSIPNWVYQSLREAPFVVVRRAPIMNGKVPIGVRGKDRTQRFGAYIDSKAILERIAPPDIVLKEIWELIKTSSPLPAVIALEDVQKIMEEFNLMWGPGGSVGFELVTGHPAVKESSDLDIIIYSEKAISLVEASDLMYRLENLLSISIDVQVETPYGAFSLKEYVRGTLPLLLKTKAGAVLVKDPWNQVILESSYD